MMMMTPSAPGGAAAADPTLPGTAVAGATPAPAGAEGQAEGTALPVLFAQLLDLASLALPAGTAGTPAAEGEAAPATGTDKPEEAAPADAALAAMMMPVLNLGLPPVTVPVTAQAASTGPLRIDVAGGQGRGATLLAGTADQARQAAADAITAANAGAPALSRLPQGTAAAAEPATARAGAEQRQAAPATNAASGNATPAAAAPATVLAAQDGGAQAGKDGQQSSGQQGETATFRGVMAAGAPAAATAAATDTVKLAGSAEQWQQPLRAALGDRLQLQLQKGGDQAVIRLDPPNLGTIEIAIRQTAGSLHVSLSATHGEVVRQLNAVGDSMRQDLAQRQTGDVAVTVTQASSRSLADSEGRGRQPEREQQQRGPGRALSEGDESTNTFAMLRE